MKPLILFFAFLAFFVNAAHAQFSGAPVCGIYYSYDANGARILREDKCVSIPDHADPAFPFSGVLYPNPTSGPFTVGFNELVQSASMTVSTIEGVVVATASMGEGYEIEGSISGRADGTYLVNVQVTREDGTQTTQSFTLIKVE